MTGGRRLDGLECLRVRCPLRLVQDIQDFVQERNLLAVEAFETLARLVAQESRLRRGFELSDGSGAQDDD